MDQSNGLVVSLGILKNNVCSLDFEVSCIKMFPVAYKSKIILINTCQTETLIVNVMRLC